MVAGADPDCSGQALERLHLVLALKHDPPAKIVSSEFGGLLRVSPGILGQEGVHQLLLSLDFSFVDLARVGESKVHEVPFII